MKRDRDNDDHTFFSETESSRECWKRGTKPFPERDDDDDDATSVIYFTLATGRGDVDIYTLSCKSERYTYFVSVLPPSLPPLRGSYVELRFCYAATSLPSYTRKTWLLRAETRPGAKLLMKCRRVTMMRVLFSARAHYREIRNRIIFDNIIPRTTRMYTFGNFLLAWDRARDLCTRTGLDWLGWNSSFCFVK